MKGQSLGDGEGREREITRCMDHLRKQIHIFAPTNTLSASGESVFVSHYWKLSVVKEEMAAVRWQLW